MARALLSPNYCSCTVNQARNLRDKDKNGEVNPFCTISTGKQKFVTRVCQKTTSPNWDDKCDFPIPSDSTIKLTVYNNNKNSLSDGEFIGRAYVSLRDLQDYDREHINWHKLSNKDGKFDKDRGEIEVSLKFYSKNNTTGSVLDLSTKKKYSSLLHIPKSLADKIKPHSKDKRNPGDNQLAVQKQRLDGDGGSTYKIPDFLDDAESESRSFTGSRMSTISVNSNNYVEQTKKKSRAPTNGTPNSSRRSITSDYETSSILDSASMYGGDETSAPALPVPSQTQQHEVNIDDNLSSKNSSSKKKTKAPIPTIITTKPTDSNRSDDIETGFESVNKSKESEKISTSDALFGLTTIRENLDTDENILRSKHQKNEEIDFNNYFNQNQEKKTKKTAPIIPQLKEQKPSTVSQLDDILTPPTSMSIKMDPASTFSTITKPSDTKDDSTDEDIDELLEKSETDNQIASNRSGALPDIVKATSKKPANSVLSVLGYENVKSIPIDPQVRQELHKLKHEDLLHVISYQKDLMKKRDTRLKELEHYTDDLLCKIVQQCPSILQWRYRVQQHIVFIGMGSTSDRMVLT